MNFMKLVKEIFIQSIKDYHKKNNISQKINNPYPKKTLEHLLYLKNWVDTIQWHLEDLIRDPNIKPKKALIIKRSIDFSNQIRTNTVELLDDFFLEQYKNIILKKNAKINTESPAWAIDRFSIILLKIFHMKEQTLRSDINQAHLDKCSKQLLDLKTQSKDLSKSIEELLLDLKIGQKYMKSYKQMKMYNDHNLNPILYNKKK